MSASILCNFSLDTHTVKLLESSLAGRSNVAGLAVAEAVALTRCHGGHHVCSQAPAGYEGKHPAHASHLPAVSR